MEERPRLYGWPATLAQAAGRRLRLPLLALGGALGALAGCAASTAPASPSAHALTAPLETTDVTVTLAALPDDAPAGSDAEPRFVAELRTRSGMSRVLDRPVLGAVSWNAGAAVLDLDRTLVFERVDGFSREVARDVVSPPTASADASRLAYAVHAEGGLFDVHVHDGSSATRVATGLVSAGAFRFSDDGRLLAFVAAENGGIAGAWVARSGGAASARCLDACDLRAGEALGAEPTRPLGADDFVELREGLLSWRDAAGAMHIRTWEAP